MPAKTQDAQAERDTKQLFDTLGAREGELFAYSVKIVCGKQTDG
jgi:hypothetical protein